MSVASTPAPDRSRRGGSAARATGLAPLARPAPVAAGRARRSALRGVAAVAVVAALTALAGCAAPAKPEVVPSDEGAEPVATILVVDNRYEPEEVEIEVGDAVRWVFQGTADHDVVAADGSFVSDLIRTGSYTHVFEEAGEWDYDCSIHPEMTGVVRVR